MYRQVDSTVLHKAYLKTMDRDMYVNRAIAFSKGCLIVSVLQWGPYLTKKHFIISFHHLFA